MTTEHHEPAVDTARGDGTRLDPGTHVVLGTGQVGREAARYLSVREADVRVVNRFGSVPMG